MVQNRKTKQNYRQREDVTMEKIFTLALLCIVWSSVAAITVIIPPGQYEYARGDNVTLPCTFKSSVPNPSHIIISWIALAQVDGTLDDDVITYYSVGSETDVASDYEGRAFLDLDVTSGKANLKLNSITLNDNREFECKVLIPKDRRGQLAAKTRLVVLAPPSPPTCKIQGTAEYEQNIELICSSEEGSPTPTYRWKSWDVSNLLRVPDPRTTDVGGVLSLYNISKHTSGFYTCTSSNKISSASCDLTLTISPPSTSLFDKLTGLIDFLQSIPTKQDKPQRKR